MAPFFIRAAGGAMQEARQDGASTGQQVFYGLTKGGIEAATELISGGIAGTGVSGLDKVVEPLIDKLAKSTAGKIALNAIYDAAMEGGEEALSDLLDPFAKLVYNDQAVREAWENRAEFGAQMLYDFLIGAAVGSIGSGTKIVTGIVTGQNAEKNAKLAEADARKQASPAPRLPVGQNNTVPETAVNPGMASNESGNLIGKTKTAPAGIKTGVTAESGITGAGETVAEASALFVKWRGRQVGHFFSWEVNDGNMLVYQISKFIKVLVLKQKITMLLIQQQENSSNLLKGQRYRTLKFLLDIAQKSH